MSKTGKSMKNPGSAYPKLINSITYVQKDGVLYNYWTETASSHFSDGLSSVTNIGI